MNLITQHRIVDIARKCAFPQLNMKHITR